MSLCRILSRRRWLLALLGAIAMVAAMPAAIAATDPAPTAAEAGQAPLPEMPAEAGRATATTPRTLTESLAEAGKVVQSGLSRSKVSLDRATQEFIDRTGLAQLGLTPNQAYGITLGVLAGAFTADALGANGLVTVGLVAVGGYLGAGVATATAQPVSNTSGPNP